MLCRGCCHQRSSGCQFPVSLPRIPPGIISQIQSTAPHTKRKIHAIFLCSSAPNASSQLLLLKPKELMPQLWGFCLSAFTGALEATLKASGSVNAACADLQSEILNEALRSVKRTKLGRGSPQPWARRRSSWCSSASIRGTWSRKDRAVSAGGRAACRALVLEQ